EKEGFEVTVRDRRVSIVPTDFLDPNLGPAKRDMMYEMYRSVEEMKKNYDLYIYLVNMKNESNNTVLRLNQWYLDNDFNLISVGSNKKIIYNT
ncbi:MAG: hypothetical protein PUK46_09010, partial [Ruminococcus sp.]|nr:hypothetical protein [Ruminococcus sp.]